MDFALDPQITNTQRSVRAFVRKHVLPLERDPKAYDDNANLRTDRLDALRAKARAAQLWAPQMPCERGGLGLPVVGMAACYEEMNWSIFGPAVFNCAAPDDGNMILLNKTATEAQKERWLQPIIDGRVRSAFAMTEPMPDAGSDPEKIQTTATRRGDHWLVNGRKCFVTAASDAQHFILIARTSQDPRRGLTAFLFDRDQPGWRVERHIPNTGPDAHGDQCEMVFEGLEISDENRLMEVGDGLKVSQIRVGTARLTHCMRCLGLAKRCLDVAADYVVARESGGLELAACEGAQLMLGEAAMQIQMGRLLTMHAAWKLDQGDFARKEVSMAKVGVAEALQTAIDTAIQLCGARGNANDIPLEWICRRTRQARLHDCALKVHKRGTAREFLRKRSNLWAWG